MGADERDVGALGITEDHCIDIFQRYGDRSIDRARDRELHGAHLLVQTLYAGLYLLESLVARF